MKTKGFTLIEVILVIVVLAIAIPGLISAVSFMTARQVNTVGATIAADLAQEKMEEIMGDRMNAARGYAYVVNANYAAETPMAAPFGNYNRTVNIICVTAADLNPLVPPACPTDFKRIQVTVSAVGVGPNVPDAVLYSVVTNH